MAWAFAANAVVFVHFLFAAFATLGALLVLRWPRVAWLHLPCMFWGGWIEFAGSVCPLTPLENRFRMLAGESGYPGGFLEHYLLAVLYPGGLTRGMQIGLGAALLALNALLYGWAWRRRGGR